MTNEIGGPIIFPALDNLMGSLSSNIVNSIHLTSTSYFFILIFSK
jgi:hypothetical protein